MPRYLYSIICTSAMRLILHPKKKNPPKPGGEVYSLKRKNRQTAPPAARRTPVMQNMTKRRCMAAHNSGEPSSTERKPNRLSAEKDSAKTPAPARTIPAINKSVFIVISGESRSIRRTSRRRLARRSFGRSGPVFRRRSAPRLGRTRRDTGRYDAPAPYSFP